MEMGGDGREEGRGGGLGMEVFGVIGVRVCRNMGGFFFGKIFSGGFFGLVVKERSIVGRLGMRPSWVRLGMQSGLKTEMQFRDGGFGSGGG